MFLANVNLTRRALKPSGGYSNAPATVSRRLASERLTQTTEGGNAKQDSEVRTCLRHDTHGFSVTYGQDVRTNYRPGTDFSKFHTYRWVDEINGAPSVGFHPDPGSPDQARDRFTNDAQRQGLHQDGQ